MPFLVAGGFYRINEMMELLTATREPQPSKRRPRFDLDPAQKWFRTGKAAREVNALLTMREIDPATVEFVTGSKRDMAGVWGCVGA